MKAEEVQNLNDIFIVEKVVSLDVPTLVGERHLVLLTKK